MNKNTRWTPCWIAALCLLSACSQGASTASTDATNPDPTSAAQPFGDAGGGKALGNPCDVITAADVADIFTTSAHRRLDDWGKDKCIYDTDSVPSRPSSRRRTTTGNRGRGTSIAK